MTWDGPYHNGVSRSRIMIRVSFPVHICDHDTRRRYGYVADDQVSCATKLTPGHWLRNQADNRSLVAQPTLHQYIGCATSATCNSGCLNEIGLL
ncbi:hypothetical protein SFRURICE_004652 [Spodoptera frugiperda]|nr:hypothetical protein SFRURICE_004652 [Spodoptera frugiperda]